MLEKLCDDGHFVLSRALANDDEETFLVYAPSAPLSTSETVARLRHVFALQQELDASFATTPRELVEEDGRPVLILDDPGATLLASTVGSPWELAPFLRVACGMAAALAGLHARGLVHKDVRPGNFFVDVADGKAWLTGFAIASRLPRERQALAPPEVIAGTLAYMSPEQTGRMNRSLDSRSDLYSLGVTLHEMVAGGLPFHAADPSEWIHCHIAREPAPLPELPEPLAAIVRKLLAKNAEDRYQTALGLELDLRRCLSELETQGRVQSFALGQSDSSERLLIPEKLYGRDADVATLRAALERVIESGQPELVLVSGYSGIGKSSVVSELHKLLVPSRSRFASGKFDQYQRDIPYATLAQAFQTLVRDILGKPDVELGAWSERILETVGPNAQLLTGLIPELRLVIGPQPPVPELPPQEARNRFQMVLRQLLGAFSKQEPLVLFLDDLQWLDGATVDLVESLFTGTPVPNLLLIGAYRDNEVGPEHPLTSAVARIRQSGAALNQVVLGPLSAADIEQLVADSLCAGRERVAPLARLIFEKTGGNPFFAIQFLDGLVGERLVVHDPSRGAWSWEPSRVFAKGFTDNVVDFMVAKLERLPTPTQIAMRHLACLGNVTSIATLELVHGAVVDDAMWDAIRAGLVFRSDRSYSFLHDRVQEAAYALIPEAQRPSEHLRIGRLLEAQLDAAEGDEQVFEIANQKNRGAQLIDDPEERWALATLNVRAGRRAKRAVAYVSARNHFAQAAALLEPDAWSRHYREIFDLFLLFSECEYLVGNFARADELFDRLLARAASDLDRTSVYVLRMRVYQVAGKYAEAVDAAIVALRLFGIVFPESEAEIAAATSAELAQIPVNLGKRAIADILDAPEITVPEVRAVIDILCDASSPAYIGRPIMFPLFMFRAVNVCLQHGNTEQTAYVYAIYGLLLVGFVNDIEAAFEFSEMSLRLNEKFDNPRLTGTLLHLHGDHVRPWKRPFADGLPLLERAFVICPQVGDLVYAGFLAFEILWQLIECYERVDEILAASTRYADFTRQTNNEPIHETIRLEQQFLKCLQGRTRAPLSFDEPDGSFDETRSVAALTDASFFPGVFFYHAMKFFAAYLLGELDEALRSAAQAEALLAAALAMPIYATFHFYHALALLAVMPAQDDEARTSSARSVAEKLDKLTEWARHCPENFGSRRALVAAEQARVEGRIADAMRLYEEAAHAAREQRQVLNEALAYELAARFFAALGSATSARAQATLARHAYGSWGALAKVQRLDQEFPELDEPLVAPLRVATATPITDLDLATVVKVSHAVSAEIVLDTLIERLLTIAIENAGASRGLLVLPRDGELYVEAEAIAVADAVEVHSAVTSVSAKSGPESILRYVARTRESVILEDAAARGPFGDDPYLATVRVRSVLCMPLVKQTRLIGLLYLENRFAPHVFTPRRIVLLELLASQSAISLENARLHADLRTTQDGLHRALRDNRLMVDAVPIHAWATRPDGFVEQLSKPWLDYTGLSREQALGWGWAAVLHPDDAPALQRLWQELLASAVGGEIESRMRRHDGVYRWFLFRTKPFIDENGQVLRWYGTNTDIDDLKRAEDELRRNERFLAEGQRLNNTGSFSWSLGTDEMTFSKEMYRIYEFEPDTRVTLAQMEERTLPEDVPLLVEKIELARRGVVDHDYEFRLRMPDGSLKHLRTNAYATHDRDGKLQFLGVIQDITDRKLAEEALTKVRSEVASMTRAASLGALTATIAHEVNQPLTGIMTNTSTCLRVLSAPSPNLESALSLVNRIARDGKRAAEVIVRLRALFGNKQATREPVDLNDATREALALSRSELDRNGVVIKTELADGLPQVSGDRIQLQQVILNFLLNASEAMRKVEDRRRELLVRTELDETDAVRLSVQDGGVGLQPDEIDKLFEAFYTTKASGMGIGLYVSRSIIETHGGRIGASQSPTGTGATFFFSIPLDPSSTGDGSAPPSLG